MTKTLFDLKVVLLERVSNNRNSRPPIDPLDSRHQVDRKWGLFFRLTGVVAVSQLISVLQPRVFLHTWYWVEWEAILYQFLLNIRSLRVFLQIFGQFLSALYDQSFSFYASWVQQIFVWLFLVFFPVKSGIVNFYPSPA